MIRQMLDCAYRLMICISLGCTVKDRNENEFATDGSNSVVFTVVKDHHRVGPGLFFVTVCTSEKALSFQHDDIGWRMGMELLDLFSFRQSET